LKESRDDHYWHFTLTWSWSLKRNDVFAGASAPPISLATDLSSDFDYENDGGDAVTSVLSEAEMVPLTVIQRRDVERQTDASSDFDYENDYDDGDVTSVFSGTGQSPSAVKQGKDVKKETGLSPMTLVDFSKDASNDELDGMSDFDYENDYDSGDAVTSEFSGPGQSPSAVKQSRDTEKENDLFSDFDYENDYDDGAVRTAMLSETENVPSAVKQRREKKNQKGIYMFAGALATPQADSPSNLDDENDYDDGDVVTTMLSGTEQSVKQRRNKAKQSDPESTRGKGCGGRLSVVILYCLVAVCFAMWATLLCLFLVKFSALSVELKDLNLNHSEMIMTVKRDLDYVKKDLDYVQATQKIIERTVSNNISELQDITAFSK
ncbi:hypothetical protein lerEdw1_016398, partial [Lerista edwardsae]